MSLRYELEDVLEELEKDIRLGSETETEKISFDLVGGGTFEAPCIPTTLDTSALWIAGGAENNVKLMVKVRRSLFVTADSTEITADTLLLTADNNSPPPRANKLATYRGKRYRILMASEDGARSYVKLDLGDVNR